MGGVCSTVAGWLEAGCNMVVGIFKWIWEKVRSLFSGLTDLARDIFGSFGFCGSDGRERSYVKSGSGRVEVGHDELRINAGINNTTQAAPFPSDPEQRKRKRDEKRKQCDLLIKGAETLKNIMDEDEAHENMAETSGKLNDFYNSKTGQELRNFLGKQPTVNPGLA